MLLNGIASYWRRIWITVERDGDNFAVILRKWQTLALTSFWTRKVVLGRCSLIMKGASWIWLCRRFVYLSDSTQSILMVSNISLTTLILHVLSPVYRGLKKSDQRREGPQWSWTQLCHPLPPPCHQQKPWDAFLYYRRIWWLSRPCGPQNCNGQSCKVAKAIEHWQFIFITPQDVSSLKTNDKLCMFKMKPSKRTSLVGGAQQ